MYTSTRLKFKEEINFMRDKQKQGNANKNDSLHTLLSPNYIKTAHTISKPKPTAPFITKQTLTAFKHGLSFTAQYSALPT